LLRDYYSAPFRMGFVEGGAKSFMASYNAWNHVPMTVNPILKSLAVKQWGADGIVSSDALAVELMVNPRPVSYTHLDVYKRQGHQARAREALPLHFGVEQGQLGIDRAGFGGKLLAGSTHLQRNAHGGDDVEYLFE